MFKKISIPKKYTPESWMKFLSENRYSKSDKDISSITIDTNKDEGEYIWAIELSSLSCLIEEYHEQGIKIEFTECHNSSNCEYLSDIRFFEYWNHGFDRSKYTPNNNSENIPLWNIQEAMISPYATHAKNFAELKWAKGKDFSPFQQGIAELLNNIIDHSDSRNLRYIMNQNHPRHGIIKISICDFGLGIPHLINEYLQKNDKPRLSNEDAIVKAFEEGFSIESTPQNRGRGLTYLEADVIQLYGSLELYSNDVCYKSDNDGKKSVQKLLTPIKGTLFDITIDTRQLIAPEYTDDELLF